MAAQKTKWITLRKGGRTIKIKDLFGSTKIPRRLLMKGLRDKKDRFE